jgi:ABC-type multidrug transport system fused ATPase/permease subunit
LNSFCAKFEKGKTTAICGPSGAGKSSIVQLIQRFYDANLGTIRVSDREIKQVCLRHLRSQIGYVSQEPVLFNTSIKKNILLGRSDATEAEVIEALKKTNAWEFVEKFPAGIETQVGASGGQLSGGQK